MRKLACLFIVLLMGFVCQVSAQANFTPPKVAQAQPKGQSNVVRPDKRSKKKTISDKQHAEIKRQEADLQQLSDYELELKAADGHVQAQYTLGKRWVMTGDSANMAKGVNWLGMAAHQGQPSAQYALGYLLYHGYGVERNHQWAKEWMQLAAANGNRKAQLFIESNHFDE